MEPYLSVALERTLTSKDGGGCSTMLEVIRNPRALRRYRREISLQLGVPVSNNRLGNESRERLKLEVIAAYGGKCVCCGETLPELLTVDHKLGDGKEDRENLCAGNGLYYHLKRSGFPKDRYQLLCMSCNWGKRQNLYCPHQRERYLFDTQWPHHEVLPTARIAQVNP